MYLEGARERTELRNIDTLRYALLALDPNAAEHASHPNISSKTVILRSIPQSALVSPRGAIVLSATEGVPKSNYLL